MPVRAISASGREALALATELLQRVRLADPLAGLCNAADVQWWSRRLAPPTTSSRPSGATGTAPSPGCS